jgi:gamma-glutamylcyclotransferase (GGCT)/AIG2-like uncharacterized protein YtfP
MLNLFTYGSLMCSDIMFKVTGCQVDCSQATLGNFFRAKIQEREYPAIVPRPGALVSGVLYFDLPPEAINKLDVFEGEIYRRQEVDVVTDNHRTMKAMTYVIKPRYRDLLTDEEWSFGYFLAFGKKKFEETYLGFQEI